MISKKFSIIILISMVLVNILGCQNFKQQKTISPDTPYYSVTIGSYEKSSNHYMNVDIEMPKITYSNQSGSALIDPLNAEIENSLNELITKAKDNALTTYNAYIVSAKANAKKDIEAKIEKLKSKYMDILSDEEKEFISKLTADNLNEMRYDRAFISSNSNVRKMRRPKGTPSNMNFVNGFTNTEDIIIPGLHNKNIIIVETTPRNLTETTLEVEGKPGRIAPSEDRPNRKNRASNSDTFSNDGRGQWQGEQRRQDNQSSQGIQNKEDNQNKLNEQNLQKEDTNFKRRIVTEEIVKATNSNTDLIIISSKSNIDISIKSSNSEIISTHDKKQFSENDDAITIKNFHRDLFDIYMTKIPNDDYLTRFYIPTTIHCNFEVKCLDEDYISLFVQLVESRNTSSIKRLFYNIDLNKGKIINIKDILGENYKENAVKVINSEIDKWTDDQKATLIENYSVEKYIDDNTPFFINNNHKAVVEIEKFAITIGAAGYHEFQIP